MPLPEVKPSHRGGQFLMFTPKNVRDAIRAVVDYNWDDEEFDYRYNCGDEPGDNSRDGHVYEKLVLIREWLESGEE